MSRFSPAITRRNISSSSMPSLAPPPLGPERKAFCLPLPPARATENPPRPRPRPRGTAERWFLSLFGFPMFSMDYLNVNEERGGLLLICDAAKDRNFWSGLFLAHSARPVLYASMSNIPTMFLTILLSDLHIYTGKVMMPKQMHSMLTHTLNKTLSLQLLICPLIIHISFFIFKLLRLVHCGDFLPAFSLQLFSNCQSSGQYHYNLHQGGEEARTHGQGRH